MIGLRGLVARRAVSLRHGVILVGLVALTVSAVTAATAASAAHDAQFDGLRRSTEPFHNLDLALAAGYEEFYQCTDKEGTGAMGQHYVKGALVEDPVLDRLRPEVLVYEPRTDVGYRLVAIEYVTLKDAWHKAFGPNPPTLFGRKLALIPAGNRYGLPDFYEIHVWLWKHNPRGRFDDWNPTVSCRGNGDPAV